MSGDILRWPLVGSFLRWPHARTILQVSLLLVVSIVVADGLFGSQQPDGSLALVLTWVHYRGLLILALLAVGNLFCAACPFVLVRDAGRRLVPPARVWPRRLRSKWPGVALLVVVLFVYELFDLWALPRATAMLALGYFAAALAVDLAFKGAAFCKYLCPIGQFNFAASTLSPFELQVRDQAVCRSCRTADCIRGASPPRGPDSRPLRVDLAVVRRGCELGLFLPMKVGNLDCTFCLDCVHACPHDNVAIARRLPGVELVDGRRRSGIGRLDRRLDLAALAVVFVFGGVLNAFAMVAPVYRLERWMAGAIGASSEVPVLAIVFGAGLVGLPAALVGGAAALTRLAMGARGRPIARLEASYVFALVPFGVGMWAAHYLFHLLTAAFAVIPIAQRAAARAFGRPLLGAPLWSLTGMRPGSVVPIQVGLLLLGAVGSLALVWSISEGECPDHPARASLSWMAVVLALLSCSLWILWQPMEMRAAGGLG